MKKILTGVLCSLVLLSCGSNETKEAVTTVGPAEPDATAAPVVSTSPTGATFIDAKYAEMGRKGLDHLSAGHIDAFMEQYAENVVWQWNNGDSIVGKAAVNAYWKKRFSEALDSLQFSNHVWLGVDVKNPQSVEQPGKWLLGWYQVYAKYKTGKRMVQWTHVDMHFDNADKVDRVIQYIDRVPINAAMKK